MYDEPSIANHGGSIYAPPIYFVSNGDAYDCLWLADFGFFLSRDRAQCLHEQSNRGIGL